MKMWRGGIVQYLLLWLVRFLFPVRKPSWKKNQLRVAFLRFDRRVGEVLLQTPLFVALRRKRPELRILAVVHPAMQKVLVGQSFVDEVIPFSFRGFPLNPRSWRSLWRLLRCRCDVAIDCSNFDLLSTTHACATLITRAHKRVGFLRGRGAQLCYSTCVAALPDEESERLQRLQLVTGIGIEPEAEMPRYSPKQQGSAEFQRFVERIKTGSKRCVIINPGGRLDWRRMENGLWVGVVRDVLKRGYQPLLVWGPQELATAEVIAQAVGEPVVVAPPTSLDELASLMQVAFCTITNNSGPMHLSVATQTPTLGIFLRMSIARWGYADPPHAAVDIYDTADPMSQLESALDRFFQLQDR